MRSRRPLTQNGTTGCKRSRRAKIFEVERAGSLHALLLPEAEKRQREDLPLTHSRIVCCPYGRCMYLYCTEQSPFGPRPPLVAPRDGSNVWQLMRSLCVLICRKLACSGPSSPLWRLTLTDRSAVDYAKSPPGRPNGTSCRRSSPDRT